MIAQTRSIASLLASFGGDVVRNAPRQFMPDCGRLDGVVETV
jgi:hypothetical protein